MGIEIGLFGIKRKQVKRYKKIKRNVIPNFNLSDLDMREISSEQAIQYISSNHYSKTCTRAISIAFGFYFDNVLVGCIVYATPVGMNVKQAITKTLDLGKCSVFELTRLFMDDKLPSNVESYCIGKTIRYIKINMSDVKYIISYSDTSFGHYGYIYQATNFLYCGDIGERLIFEYKGREYHGKTLSDAYGTASISKLKEILGDDLVIKHSKTKNRYIYVLGQSKREHKELLNELAYEVLPYPKGDIKFYKLE